MAAASPTPASTYYDVDDTVMTGEAVALELRPTGFVLAALGALIDWVVYFVGGLLVLTFAILTPLLASPLGQDSATVAAFVSVGIVLVLIVIPVAVELLSGGKSLGRLAVGARIVRDDGGAIGFRHAFIRQLVAFLDLYLTFGGCAAIFGLLNGKSKRLGDYLAGTYSQYERVASTTNPVFGVPTELRGWALTADVARIPNRLSLRLSRFLRQAGQLTPLARDQLARRLGAEVSAWVSSVPAVEAELFLAAVVALRRDREFAALQLDQARLSQLDAALTGLPYGFPTRAE